MNPQINNGLNFENSASSSSKLHFGAVVALTLILRAGPVLAQGRPDIVWQATHANAVFSVQYSKDCQLLATGSADETIKIWRAGDGALLHTFLSTGYFVMSVAFSQDKEFLAAGTYDGTVLLYRVSDGQLLHTLAGHTGSVLSVAFSKDGSTIASSSSNGEVKLWVTLNGQLLRNLLLTKAFAVWTVVFTPDGLSLAASCGDRLIRIWRTSDWTLRQTIASDETGIAISPDGKLVASYGDSIIELFRLSDGMRIATMVTPSSLIKSAAFSPDSRTLISGHWFTASNTGLLRVWRANGAIIHTFDEEMGRGVFAVDCSGDGHIAYARYDGGVVVAKNPFTRVIQSIPPK